MALSVEAKSKTKLAILELVGYIFPTLSNSEDLIQTVYEYFDLNELDLGYYSGVRHTDLIINGLREMVDEEGFNLQKARAALPKIAKGLHQIDQVESELYSNQAPEITLLHQLQEKGYVDSDHLVTDKEMKQVLDSYLQGKVAYTDPISISTDLSIVHDNGQVLKQSLQAAQFQPGKLLIPANVGGNHWLLIIREEAESNVIFTCWDSLRKTRSTNPTLQLVQSVVEEVYGEENRPKVVYEFADEQNDSVTCGYRVAQKALKVAGIENALTATPSTNPARLTYEFTKALAETDQETKELDLHFIDEGNTSLIYAANHPNSEVITSKVASKKNIQETSDANLAIALQDIYWKYRHQDIDSGWALEEAKKQLRTMKLADIREKKDQVKSHVVHWMQNYHKSKQALVPKHCRQEVADETNEAESQTRVASSVT